MSSTDNSLSAELSRELEEIRSKGLERRLRAVESPQSSRIQISGRELLNFSSNDYLGLAGHPALREAAIKAVESFGAGSGASRLICGSLKPHHDLEDRLASFKGTEAALTFSTGYAAALGTITALVGKDDIVIIDKLVHASIIDAVRLSGARLRVFRHNDLNDLERMLKWTSTLPAKTDQARRILVITESVFSMDGDVAPLTDIVRLKDQYGAWLMVDEAHATGLFGERCSGLVEEFGLSDQVEIQMATLGKALGASGGAICGSQTLINFLINRARSFIYSTAPTPASSAAATAALELLATPDGRSRRDTLWALIDQLKSSLLAENWSLPPLRSAIVPLIVGEESKAVSMAGELNKLGVFIPAIRHPTVARGSARLRVTMTASHTIDDISILGKALSQARQLATPEAGHA